MPRRARLSLTVLLIIPMLAIVLASSLTVYWLTASGGRQATALVSDRLRVSTAASVADAVLAYLGRALEILTLNQSYLAKGLVDTADPVALGRLFLCQIRANQDFTYIFYGSAAGWYVGANRNPDTGEILLAICARPGEPLKSYRVDPEERPVGLVAQTDAFDPRVRPWYLNALAGRGPAWYPVYKYAVWNSLGTGVSVADIGPDGAVRGVLTADVALRQMSAFLSAMPVGDTGISAVLDSAGQLLASSFLPEPFRRDAAGIARFTVDTVGRDALARAWDRIKMALAAAGPDAAGRFAVDSAAGSQLVDWRLVSLPRNQRFVVLTVVPARDFFDTFETAARQSLIATLAMLAAAVGLILLSARRLTLPIRRLGDHAEAVASGGSPDFAFPSRVREIERLGGQLTVMSRELTASRERLEGAMVQSSAELRDARNRLSFTAFNAANIAHELQGPLGNSLLAASSLGTRTADIRGSFGGKNLTQAELSRFLDECTEIAAIIQSNLERSATVARGFKDVQVDQLGESKREIELQAYLDQILFSYQPLLRREDIKVRRDWGAPVRLTIDPGLLSHILANLINNTVAHAFVEPTGRPKEISLGVCQDDNCVLFTFADNGRGMDAAVVGRIFDPLFTTAREQGSSGLGMSIIRRLIEKKAGGTIRVESAPDIGSRFLIRLPLAAPANP
jgi:signal transduction histidine kinase